MRFSENVSSLGTYGPIVRRILLHQTFVCGGAAKSAVFRDRPRTLNELRTAITVYIRNISQADLQKVFANKIKWVQACMDARGRHFQHLFYVHSDFPNTLYINVMLYGWKFFPSNQGE
jgi:hypothetical protein